MSLLGTSCHVASDETENTLNVTQVYELLVSKNALHRSNELRYAVL